MARFHHFRNTAYLNIRIPTNHALEHKSNSHKFKPYLEMREKGVEPLHLAVQEPKSCASNVAPALHLHSSSPKHYAKFRVTTDFLSSNACGRAGLAGAIFLPNS